MDYIPWYINYICATWLSVAVNWSRDLSSVWSFGYQHPHWNLNVSVWSHPEIKQIYIKRSKKKKSFLKGMLALKHRGKTKVEKIVKCCTCCSTHTNIFPCKISPRYFSHVCLFDLCLLANHGSCFSFRNPSPVQSVLSSCLDSCSWPLLHIQAGE